MITFALTGGIGSGKSSVARLFAGWGVPVVDADRVARVVVDRGTRALAEIAAQFGPHVLTEHGELDRAALGRLVFSDPDALARLNAIVHPEIRRWVDAELSRLAQAGQNLACYEIPLLFETQQQHRYRPVVVVVADDATRIERIMSRDGLDHQAAVARLHAQLPLAEKARLADIVIANDGGFTELEHAAASALARVRAWQR